MAYIPIPNDDESLLAECKIETFRSGGKGGQHANKTESAVRLTHIKSGIQVTCQDERSQLLNKRKCIKELRKRIKANNFIPKRRIKSRPTKSSIEKRLSSKKHLSDKKKNRKKPDLSDY